MSGDGNERKVSKKKKVKFIAITLLFLLVFIIVIGEALLYFMNYQSSFDKMKVVSDEQASWWTCDSINGPRYVPDGVTAADSVFLSKESWYYNRLKVVNNQGYHDTENFTDSSSTNDSIKVLVAGDSFTWGASADVDSSYVNVFERDLKNKYPSAVWNTGIPATGTNHALFTIKKFLPIQKSNFVVLGFYVGNDFDDNLLPFDKLVFNKLASCFNLYENDKDLNPVEISKAAAYKKITGSLPMQDLNWFQKITVRSRFITFISDLKTKIKNRLSGNKKRESEAAYNRTFSYLKELRDYTTANNAEMIVLLIPSSEELGNPSTRYQQALSMLNELSVKHVEVVNDFSEPADYIEPGGHWNNQGHKKAGHKLSAYLLKQLIKN